MDEKPSAYHNVYYKVRKVDRWIVTRGYVKQDVSGGHCGGSEQYGEFNNFPSAEKVAEFMYESEKRRSGSDVSVFLEFDGDLKK